MVSHPVLRRGVHYGSPLRRLELAGVSLTDLRDQRGAPVPTHTHESAHLCYVTRGWYLTFQAGAVRSHTPRTTIFYPSGATHRDQIHPAGGRCVTVAVADAVLGELGSDVPALEQPVIVRDPELAWLMDRLVDAAWHAADPLPLVVRGLALAAWGRAVHARRLDHRPPAWLREAHRSIGEHCTKPLELETLARRVGVHPTHLARRFRDAYGMTPGDHHRRCRVELARTLLTRSGAPLTQVALQCGYADQSAFTRSFRKLTGTTPGTFRRRFAR